MMRCQCAEKQNMLTYKGRTDKVKIKVDAKTTSDSAANRHFLWISKRSTTLTPHAMPIAFANSYFPNPKSPRRAPD